MDDFNNFLVYSSGVMPPDQDRSHLQEVGSFHTAPISLLEALYSFWEWHGSLMGAYLPRKLLTCKGR